MKKDPNRPSSSHVEVTRRARSRATRRRFWSDSWTAIVRNSSLRPSKRRGTPRKERGRRTTPCLSLRASPFWRRSLGTKVSMRISNPTTRYSRKCSSGRITLAPLKVTTTTTTSLNSLKASRISSRIKRTTRKARTSLIATTPMTSSSKTPRRSRPSLIVIT